MTATVCQGCGAELPLSKNPGNPRKWCSDFCRKRTLYGKPCADCGAQTSHPGRGNVGHVRCADCMGVKIHAERHWTPERIVAGLQEWAKELGRPPTAREALRGGCPVPCARVQREFGSWNAGMAAAGFTPRGIGQHGPRRKTAA